MMALLFSRSLFAQRASSSRSIRILKQIKHWDCSNLELLSERQRLGLGHKAIAGVVRMSFVANREEKNLIFSLEMNRNQRKFVCEIEQDSIHFLGDETWNAYRIISITRKKLILEQEVDDTLFRWTMQPSPKNKQ